jgi:hypothetical protein
MMESNITLASLTSLLEVDKKPWISGGGGGGGAVGGDTCVVCGDRASGRHYGGTLNLINNYVLIKVLMSFFSNKL